MSDPCSTSLPSLPVHLLGDKQGRPLLVYHPAHGGVLVHGGPAALSDSAAAHRPLPLHGHLALQQGLPPVLPRHQLPLPQWPDHGQRH
uniref:Solute carrier family 13 member 3 n=2 Tax=Cercopithecinae TaxID=9528 RepID=A0A2K5Z4F1_MANLE